MSAWAPVKKFGASASRFGAWVLESLTAMTLRANYPPETASVEERVASLCNFEESESDSTRRAEARALRVEFQNALKELPKDGGPRRVIIDLSAPCLTLIEWVLERQGRRRPNENLFACISLASGDDKSKPPPPGLELPFDVRSYFEQIRIYTNKARHTPNYTWSIGQARIALDSFLSVLEWYYREYKEGDRLPTIYAGASKLTLLPHPPWAPLPFLPIPVLVALLAWLALSLPGFLCMGPVALLLAYGAVFLFIVWLTYRLFYEDAHKAPGRWRRWVWLWGLLFASAFLLIGTSTSAFLGKPLDERRYIAPEMLVNRTRAPDSISIPLTPTLYAAYFDDKPAPPEKLKGKEAWAASNSLSSWKSWVNRGLTDDPILPNQRVVVYQSDPLQDSYDPFNAKLVFLGNRDLGGNLGKQGFRVKLLDSFAALRHSTPHGEYYQQLDFWRAERHDLTEGQLATRNVIEGIILTQGDSLIIVARLASLDGRLSSMTMSRRSTRHNSSANNTSTRHPRTE